MVLVTIMEEIDILKQSLIKAPIIWKGDYPYFIHPITDGVPRLEPKVLEAIIELSVPLIDWENIDVILGIEAMGKSGHDIKSQIDGIEFDMGNGVQQGNASLNPAQAASWHLIGRYKFGQGWTPRQGRGSISLRGRSRVAPRSRLGRRRGLRALCADARARLAAAPTLAAAAVGVARRQMDAQRRGAGALLHTRAPGDGHRPFATGSALRRSLSAAPPRWAGAGANPGYGGPDRPLPL